MATYYSRPCDACGTRELTDSRTGLFVCFRCEGAMKHRCNGCGSLYNGLTCGICESARDDDETEPLTFASQPRAVEAHAPTCFVAAFFFVFGMMFAAVVFFATVPKR